MNSAKVIFFKDGDSIPALEFMYYLKEQDYAAFETGVARVKLLQEFGHRLRRPAADILEDGIYELRWKKVNVQYRLLYFFHQQDFIVLAHGIHKKGKQVDKQEIKRARERRDKFVLNPKAHRLEQEIEL